MIPVFLRFYEDGFFNKKDFYSSLGGAVLVTNSNGLPPMMLRYSNLLTPLNLIVRDYNTGAVFKTFVLANLSVTKGIYAHTSSFNVYYLNQILTALTVNSIIYLEWQGETAGEDIISYFSEPLLVKDNDYVKLTFRNNITIDSTPIHLLDYFSCLNASVSLPAVEVTKRGYDNASGDNVFTFVKYDSKRTLSFIAPDFAIEAAMFLQLFDAVTIYDSRTKMNYNAKDIEVESEKIDDETALVTITFLVESILKPNV